MINRFFNLLTSFMSDAWVIVKWVLTNHFDKGLLSGLFIMMVFIILHIVHHTEDVATVAWAREQANLIIGALLGLVSGKIIEQAKNHPPNSPPDPPTQP